MNAVTLGELLRQFQDDSFLITQEELIGIQNNDPNSMHAIGNKYHMQSNYTRSMEWYLRSTSINDNSHACCMIGLQFMLGQGVPVDRQKTMEWHLKATNQGIATAQYRVGILTETSHDTHSANKQDALEWYHRSMENGYREASEDISRLNTEGYFLQAEQMATLAMENVFSKVNDSVRKLKAKIMHSMKESINSSKFIRKKRRYVKY